MPLTLSTHTYSNVEPFSTVNFTQLRFKPTVGEVPNKWPQSCLKYSCWGSGDIDLVYYGAVFLINGAYLWGDDSPPPDYSGQLWGHRVTGITLDSAPNVFSYTWDRFEMVDLAGMEARMFGHLSSLLFAVYNADLNANFYPDPTHLFFSYSGNSGPSVLSSTPPTHPKAVIQPYRYDSWRGAVLSLTDFQGIGPLQEDGTRLLTMPFSGNSFAGVGSRWFRPSDGVRLFSDLSEGQPQLMYSYTPAPLGLRPTRTAAYGLPPAVEVSGNCVSSDEGGATLITSVDIRLHLFEYDLDGNETDTVVATENIPLVYSGTIFGVSYKTFLLNPTNVSSVGTIADTTVRFKYGWDFLVNGSIVVAQGSPAGGAPAPYKNTSVVGNAWHKVPCIVLPYGVTGAYANEGDYLPGWLYDPSA